MVRRLTVRMGDSVRKLGKVNFLNYNFTVSFLLCDWSIKGTSNDMYVCTFVHVVF